MSRRVTATHADWLTLVEPTGPFLTLPVARRVGVRGWTGYRPTCAPSSGTRSRRSVPMRWPAGLCRLGPAAPSSFGRTVREGQAVPATCTVTLPEHGVLLRPDFAVVEPADETRARLLVTLWPRAPPSPLTCLMTAGPRAPSTAWPLSAAKRASSLAS